MGRGGGKAKKQTVLASQEDPWSGEGKKVPAYRRRGRPAKPQKDKVEEEEEEADNKDEDGWDPKDPITGKDLKNLTATENGRKRKRPGHAKENLDSVKEENGIGAKSNTNDLMKNAGFRQNTSRRKNKPRRAAEAGVECK